MDEEEFEDCDGCNGDGFLVTLDGEEYDCIKCDGTGYLTEG